MEKFKKAFTFIELIVSLVIFGIGLLIILRILDENVFLARKVQITTQATLLAKDAMELVYNVRDTNYIKFRKWNYITGSNGSEKHFTLGKYYKIYTDLSRNKINMEELSTEPNFLTTRLYILTGVIENSVGQQVYSGFWYNYNTGEKTNFGRYVYFTGVYLAPEGGTKNDYILKLISVVPYKFGGYHGKIKLESFISNWRWSIR